MLDAIGIQANGAGLNAAPAADAGRFIHAARVFYVIHYDAVVCLGHRNIRIRNAKAGHAAAKYDLAGFF